jgi:hypothetical protein
MPARYLTLFYLSLLILVHPLLAQDDYKSEVFGGYQYTHFNRFTQFSLTPVSVNGNGWNASFTRHLTDWIGVKADVSGAYATNLSSHENNGWVNLTTYTFGPVISAHANRGVSPFGEILLGGYLQSARIGATVNGFALLVGGGVDVDVRQHLAIRALEVDWMGFLTNNNPPGLAQSQNGKSNVRLSTGIVFRF